MPSLKSFYIHLTFEDNAISSSDYRTNRNIRARQVRLIDENGDNVGIVDRNDALDRAAEAGLDLVEVSANADPPVCKIMDYGKFQYNQAKKARKARQNEKKVEIKEIRLRPKTDDFHIGISVKNARKWLEDGMKVRVRVRFRGREITYPEIARERLQKIANDLTDVAVIEQQPSMEGRTMLMVLAPEDSD